MLSPASRPSRPSHLVRLVLFVSSASVHLLRPSRASVRLSPASVRLSPASVRLSPASIRLSPASVVSVCVRLCCLVCFCLLRLSRLVLSVSSVSSVLCVMCNSNGWIVYLPIHSNALNSISLKRLSGSTCLTGFNLSGVFGVFGVFEVFKGVRRVQSSTHITP